MDRKGLIICGVVGFLALLSAATGFAAEATRIKVKVPVLDEKFAMVCISICLFLLNPPADIANKHLV